MIKSVKAIASDREFRENGRYYDPKRPKAPSMWVPENEIWNVPEDVNEVLFEIQHTGFPFASIRSVKGLAMDEKGNIYGERVLSDAREAGYQMEGRVSIGGEKYRAFTSSQLFTRHLDEGCPDNTKRCRHLVDVAILYVCKRTKRGK